ncbi:MAG: SpaA isopeptide-forming pilin-related protein [Lachnospiraceae bacterium]
MGKKKKQITRALLGVLILLAFLSTGAAAQEKKEGKDQIKTSGLPEQIITSEADKERQLRNVEIGGTGTLYLKGSPITSGEVPVIDAWNIYGTGMEEHASFIQLKESGASAYWDVYCMDYGKMANTGTAMSGRDFNSLGEPKKTWMTACLSFGFCDQAMTLTDPEKAKYAATQAMVWNIMSDVFGTDTGDAAAMTYLSYVAQPQTAKDYYWQLKGKILSYGKIPEFTFSGQGEAPVYELQWNASAGRYETTLEDGNAISGACTFANSAGVDVEVHGTQVTLSTANAILQPVLLNGKRTDFMANKCVMYWNDDNATQRFGVSDFTATIENAPFYYQVKTEPIFGEIQIKKVDAQTNESLPQGAGANFQGTVYGVYNHQYQEGDQPGSPSYVDAVTITENGTGKLGGLLPGVYYVKEQQGPQGYELDLQVHKIELLPEHAVGNLITASLVSREKVIQGDVEIVKFGQDKPGKEGEMKHPLAGVEFTLTSKTTGKKYVMKTDQRGYASTKQGGNPEGNLPYDTYVLEETKGQEGYKTIEPMEITIATSQQLLSYIIEDKQISSALRIEKVDKETGKRILIAGTTFRIEDSKGKEVVMYTYYPKKEEHRTFETDETGTLLLPQQLPRGTYRLLEVKAPSGYLKGEPVEFTIENAASYEQPLVVTCADEKAYGRIQIIKTDEHTKDPLGGVTFQVKAKEDIVTPDGTLRVSKGEVVEELVTKEDGTAMTGQLFLGTYEVIEMLQKPGYVRTSKAYEVTLAYKDQVTPVVETVLPVHNQPTQVVIVKKVKGSDTPLEGVSFMVKNKALPEEGIDQSMIEPAIYVTDKKGKVKMSYLMPGTYGVKEIKTVPGYILDETEYEFTIAADGRVDGEEQKIISVENDYTKTVISKQTVTSQEELPGAHLLVQNQKGETVDEWTSETAPHLITCLKQEKTYYLIEKRAPKGYEIAETISFQVKNTGEVQKIIMKDKEKPLETNTPKTPKTPKTGDITKDWQVLIFFLILSCVTMSVCVKITSRKD